MTEREWAEGKKEKDCLEPKVEFIFIFYFILS
jgi:hypothetical protein